MMPRRGCSTFRSRPAWLDLRGRPQILGDPVRATSVVLDAEDGTVLFRKNLTNFQTQPATYVVYNADSPAPLSPTHRRPGGDHPGALHHAQHHHARSATKRRIRSTTSAG